MFLPVLVYTGAGSNIYIYIYTFFIHHTYIICIYIYAHYIYVFTNLYTYIDTHHIFLDIILMFNPTDCQGLLRVSGRFGSGTNGTARARWTTIGSPFCCLCTFQVREGTGQVVHFVGKFVKFKLCILKYSWDLWSFNQVVDTYCELVMWTLVMWKLDSPTPQKTNSVPI